MGPVDASLVPRFVGESTFARLPRPDQTSDIDIAVLGVPFDGGVTFRPGARFGPAHIRESSRLIRPYNPVLDVEPFALAQVVDAGDLPVSPFSLAAAMHDIQAGAHELLQRARRLVTLGGDHSIALPLLREAHARYGPIAVLHFDAHLDTWDSYFGEPVTHGTPFRRAAEEGLLDPEGCVHIGIRGSLFGRRDLVDDSALGFRVIPAHLIDDLGCSGILAQARARMADRPVYVSVDIDVLEPGLAPGTGTPEAGGLLTRELLSIVRGLAGLTVIGADVVEVAPAYDHAQVTGIAAANVVYEILSVMAAGPAPR